MKKSKYRGKFVTKTGKQFTENCTWWNCNKKAQI